MKRILYALMLIQPLFVCAQDLQTVTNTGNSTSNLLRLTGVGKIPVTGKGLELYTYDIDNQGIIQVYDRDLNLPMRLVLQPNASSVTSIHPAGGRLLVNGAADDPGAALVVNGHSTFSSTLGPVKRGVSIFSDELNSGRTVLCMDANGGDCVGDGLFLYLGDTQAKLLLKIEELTLYIIDLNKKVEQQQAQIKSLQEGRL